MSDFIFGGSKITAEGECSHEIKRRLLLGRKVMINLDNIFKSRDITLPTKLRLAKAGWHHWLNGCVFKWTRELVMDMEAWRAGIHGATKSWTRLSDWNELNWSDMYLKSESESRSVVPDSLQPHILYSSWNSLGQNTGVGSIPFLSPDSHYSKHQEWYY